MGKLERLPHELIINILHYLSVKDILILRQTCKNIQLVTHADSIWKEFIHQLYPIPTLLGQGELQEHIYQRLVNVDYFWKKGTPLRGHRLVRNGPDVHCGEVRQCKLVDNGNLLLTAGIDSSINIFNLAKLDQDVFQQEPKSNSFSKSSMFGTPRQRKPEQKTFATHFIINDDISCIDFERINESLAYIAVGSYDGAIACQIHSLLKSKQFPSSFGVMPIISYKPEKWVGVQALSFSGNLVAMGAYNGLVHFWNWKIDKTVGIIDWLEKNPVANVKLYAKSQHVNNDMLLMASTNGTISLFRLPSEWRLGIETKDVPQRVLFTNIVESLTILSVSFSDIIPIPGDFSLRMMVTTPSNKVFTLTFARLSRFCQTNCQEEMEIICPVSDIMVMFGFRALCCGIGKTGSRCAFGFGISTSQNWLALYTSPNENGEDEKNQSGISNSYNQNQVNENEFNDDMAVFYLAHTTESDQSRSNFHTIPIRTSPIPTLSVLQTAFPSHGSRSTTVLTPTSVPRNKMPLGMGIESPIRGHLQPVDLGELQSLIIPTSDNERNRFLSSIDIGGWAESRIVIGTSTGRVWIFDFDKNQATKL